MSTGLEIWEYVLPKLRQLKVKSVEVHFINGGDIVESRIQMAGPGTLDRSITFRPKDNFLYYPCPGTFRVVEFRRNGNSQAALHVETKGSSGDNVSGWNAHKRLLETVSFDAIELAEKSFCEYRMKCLDYQLGIARRLRGNLRELL